MQIRITKLRVATAALFVLAGIGLASILSPLIGSALATAGQIVNVSDPSASYTARVDSTGALKTAGLDAPTLPRLPFNSSSYAPAGPGYSKFLGPTTATVALTDLKIANNFANNGARHLTFYEFSSTAAPTCTIARTRYLGVYDVPPRDSIHANFETPLVLKPLQSGDAWCLMVNITAPTGDVNNAVGVSVGGYVPLGTFVPSSSSAPQAKLRAGRRMR